MAALQLRSQFHNLKVTGYPVSVAIKFYFDNKRRHDLDNALSTVMDALAASEIIGDDSVDYVDCISIEYGGYDKLNPRCEIYLDE